jgi:hypothetical protein
VKFYNGVNFSFLHNFATFTYLKAQVIIYLEFSITLCIYYEFELTIFIFLF